MTDSLQLSLSAVELELVCNKDWLLTKQIIIDKVYVLFGVLAQKMQQHVLTHNASLPADVTESSPKIARGENYRGLPYVMLDYPRHFEKTATVSIRTFFWWGNFFSISLHMSGIVKENALPFLKNNFDLLRQKGYYLCIHSNPWEHYYEEDNYRLLKNYSAAEFAAMIEQMDFVKIALPIPLAQWEIVPAFVEQHFTEMMQLLTINFPSGEIDL